jgi:hypothetical protein
MAAISSRSKGDPNRGTPRGCTAVNRESISFQNPLLVPLVRPGLVKLDYCSFRVRKADCGYTDSTVGELTEQPTMILGKGDYAPSCILHT